MRITVVPASTRTGGEIVRTLLGHKCQPLVRAVYRELSKVPADIIKHPRLEAVKGSVDDGASLDFAGSDAVIAITPPTYDTPIITHATKVSENTREGIQRAKSVKRLVLLSSGGAQFDHGVGEIKSNNIAERTLKDASPEVVFVRCAYFMANWASARDTVESEVPFFYSTVTPVDFKVPMVATEDVARVLSELAVEVGSSLPACPHIFELHGPRTYSPLDVQSALQDISGKKVEIRAIESGDLAGFFGQIFPPHLVGDWVEMATSFLPGGILYDAHTPEEDIVRGRIELKDALEKTW